MVSTKAQMRCFFPSAPTYPRLPQSTWACSPAPSQSAWSPRADGPCGGASRIAPRCCSSRGSPGRAARGAPPRSSPAPRPSGGQCARPRGTASSPGEVGAWSSSPTATSGTSAPCSGPSPVPERLPGLNVPDRASRISLSSLHLSASLAGTSTITPWMMLPLSRWLNSNL